MAIKDIIGPSFVGTTTIKWIVTRGLTPGVEVPNIIALHRYQRNIDDVMIYENTDGTVVAAIGYGAPSRTVIATNHIIGVFAFQYRGTTIIVRQDGTGAVNAEEF